MVAHNTVYTYIASYLRSAEVPLSVDVALVTFGVAALAGIGITAALVDRGLRPLVLVSIALFITAGVVFVVGRASVGAVLAAIVLWGQAYGGAATQLQTAISEASGENADVANSMLGVSFNLAIFAAGVLGAVLISTYNGLALPVVMIGLALIALGICRHRPPGSVPSWAVNPSETANSERESGGSATGGHGGAAIGYGGAGTGRRAGHTGGPPKQTQRSARRSATPGTASDVGCRLGPGPQHELPEDATHVVADRTRAEEQPLSDLGVGQSLCQQSQHIPLARGERLDRSGGRWRGDPERPQEPGCLPCLATGAQ
jgi:hypothetical protein